MSVAITLRVMVWLVVITLQRDDSLWPVSDRATLFDRRSPEMSILFAAYSQGLRSDQWHGRRPATHGISSLSLHIHHHAERDGNSHFGLALLNAISENAVTKFASPSIQRSASLAQLPLGFWVLANC